ncbi:Mu transposase C-terminal domain-containing protein [Herbaspirillum huttiense]|uniref:Mu transposase C-terminal domain-containing protein n=1 Tax=Herbaspirillum huttiense TaxID=863372 RepID=UPI0031D1B136
MSEEAFEPIRDRVDFNVGMLVQRGDDVFRIDQVLDFESAVGVELSTGRSSPLRLGDLRPLKRSTEVMPLLHGDLATIADEDWRVAQSRLAAIQPLLNRMHIGRDEVESRGKEVGVNPATLYRWIQRYNAYGVASALIPQKRGWKAGKIRIDNDTDALIEQVIRNFYLTPQRPTVQKAVIEVQRACHAKGIKPPGASTIRSRIARISEKEQLRCRGYRELAKNKFFPTAGTFPNADFPLAVMQIDHTPVDIILVDDVHRKPIGRPWITLAIDVHSRMVTGYYLSFDPPSETSVAMCVAHSILPKEDWLLLHKVDAEWPVWGIPKTIHVDNGADFRSNNFQQSCLMYGISLEFRPVKQPRYGGHIERMLGTLLHEIHALPGTTFSSVKAREGYDSEKHAAMTKSEFEEWLVTLICKVYHRRLHSTIGLTPTKKWEIGIFGNAEIHGVGIPPRPTNRLTILLDFLPHFRRTVQTFGVTIDGLTYYAEALRPWINTQDPETKRKRELVFRRDPRDVSSIWFFDPLLKSYFKIPLADQALPSMSVWEYQQAREQLKREGIASVDEHQILRAITELRNRIDAASAKTKAARRQAQRRKEHAKNVSPAHPLSSSAAISQSTTIMDDALVDGDIDDFGDIA